MEIKAHQIGWTRNLSIGRSRLSAPRREEHCWLWVLMAFFCLPSNMAHIPLCWWGARVDRYTIPGYCSSQQRTTECRTTSFDCTLRNFYLWSCLQASASWKIKELHILQQRIQAHLRRCWTQYASEGIIRIWEKYWIFLSAQIYTTLRICCRTQDPNTDWP